MAQATVGVPATSLNVSKNSGTQVQAVPQPSEKKAEPALNGDSYQRRSRKDVKSAVVINSVAYGAAITVGTGLWRFISNRSWGTSAAAAAVTAIGPEVLKGVIAGVQRALPATKAVDSNVTNHIAQHASLAAVLKILGNSWMYSLIAGGLLAVTTNFLTEKLTKAADRQKGHR
jgi:hypothetical protein